jgi:hypothetical protein
MRATSPAPSSLSTAASHKYEHGPAYPRVARGADRVDALAACSAEHARGPAAIAGYGTGAGLEYLLVPLIFGLGGPLVAMVGTSIGAENRERALRTAWIGATMAMVLTETIGLCAAAFPTAWLSLFDTNPQMLDPGARYLRAAGPFYGMFGLALSLYFASQGAGRLLWPLIVISRASRLPAWSAGCRSAGPGTCRMSSLRRASRSAPSD